MENFCIIKKFLPFYYWNALNTLYIYKGEENKYQYRVGANDWWLCFLGPKQ